MDTLDRYQEACRKVDRLLDPEFTKGCSEAAVMRELRAAMQEEQAWRVTAQAVIDAEKLRKRLGKATVSAPVPASRQQGDQAEMEAIYWRQRKSLPRGYEIK